jgi:hypothetical protein
VALLRRRDDPAAVLGDVLCAIAAFVADLVVMVLRSFGIELDADLAPPAS